jgi:hypothetical protein
MKLNLNALAADAVLSDPEDQASILVRPAFVTLISTPTARRILTMAQNVFSAFAEGIGMLHPIVRKTDASWTHTWRC